MLQCAEARASVMAAAETAGDGLVVAVAVDEDE